MIPAPQDGGRERIDALTGLRFFAAILVVFHHTGWFDLDPAGVPYAVLNSGYVAVTMFYVLSGYILTKTYRSKLGGPERRPGALREFYVARFARIYPVYALALVLTLPFSVHFVLHTLDRQHAAIWGALAIPQCAALVQAWNPLREYHINSPGWSLSAEMFFYLMFPLLLPRLLAARLRSVVLVAATTVVVSAAIPTVLLVLSAHGALDAHHHGLWKDYTVGEILTNAIGYGPAIRIADFLLGMIAARVSFSASKASLATGPGIRAWLGLSIAGAIVLEMIYFGRHPEYRCLAQGVAFTPLFCLLVYRLGASARDHLAAFLSLPWLVFLGEASYAVYILQEPIYNYTKAALGVRGATNHLSPPALALYVLALVAISSAVFVLVERPARRFLRDRLSPREQDRAKAA